MKEINGIYTSAKIMTDDVEDYAKAQIQMICDQEAARNSKIRVMPDVHPGKVGPIGLTMTIGEKLIPQLLGIDIGCGVTCVRLKEKRMEYQKLEKVIRDRIPAGFAIRENVHYLTENFDFTKLRCHKHVQEEKDRLALGSLGGGNHFIEIDQGEDKALYLVIHSGSRRLGKEVAEYYTREGEKELKQKGQEVPYPLTWITGSLLEDYLHDVQVVQSYAKLNREIMIQEILKGMKLKAEETIMSVHNYLDCSGEGPLLRKGAISAKKGEAVIIPVNMRDGVILGTGLGNLEWNQSAPHGSGRKYRRDEVKNHYTVSTFKKAMKGIYSESISAETLDEAPFAYRSLDEIKDTISETVKIREVIRPVYSFKSGI